MASHSTASTAWRATATVSAYYALFGAFIPWLSRWMETVAGFSGETIGLVFTISTLARILIGPLTSAWADGRRDRRTPIVALGVITLLAFLALIPRGLVLKDFALLFVTQVTVWGLIAFLEAALFRLTGKSEGPAYGFARGLASAAFILGNFGVGLLIDWFDARAILAWMIVMAAVMVLLATQMTPEPQEREAGQPFAARLAEGLAMLKRPEFFLLAFAAGIIQGAHQYYYIFSNLIWRDAQGFSGFTIGTLQALGVFAEVLFLMFVAGRLERVSPATLILLGGLASVVRWVGLSMEPGLLLLVPLQVLHALTFAFTFLGTMRGIQLLFGDERGATAQMIYQSLANAPATAAASYLAGRLYGAGLGADGYWSMAALGGVGAVMAGLLLLRLRSGAGLRRA
ncbi:MAG: MFS transporter [Thermaurantiacus tibetensis]|uniref:MFS transporter n=1 Tax=Thermaurantiacus tibetensis TaxID=2759035 RepID=UPI001890063F|nr:MFS transporter [Thermaurantiacus tibetensis]